MQNIGTTEIPNIDIVFRCSAFYCMLWRVSGSLIPHTRHKPLAPVPPFSHTLKQPPSWVYEEKEKHGRYECISCYAEIQLFAFYSMLIRYLILMYYAERLFVYMGGEFKLFRISFKSGLIFKRMNVKVD